MRVLADFLIESDLRLPDDSPLLTVLGPEKAWELVLSNVDQPKDAEAAHLAARLTFEHVGALGEARGPAQGALALALNALAYVTSRKFAHVALLKLIDWTPGKVERDAIICHASALDDRTEPGLTTELVDSATRFLAMHSGEEQSLAMRFYRLGIESEEPEQQFLQFWYALEIAAQALKNTERRPSRCPRCHSPLYCERCGEHPTHRPYPREAIRQLVERVHPRDSAKVFETLEQIRHTLAHGHRIAAIEPELPYTSREAVDKLASVAWSAIGRMFDKPDPGEGRDFHLGRPETVVRSTLIMAAHVITTLLTGGDPNNPSLEFFPKIDVKMELLPRRPSPASQR